MRFIATADWQLGMTAHFLGDEARPRFHQDRLDAVGRIAALAAERGAAFVVVGGDVFESNQLDRAVVARAVDALRAFTVPIVLLPGNHDPLDAASVYDSPAFKAAPSSVRVLRDAGPVEVVPGAEVVGAPWPSKRPLGDLVADALAPLRPVAPGTVRVVVGHGAVSTLDPDRTSAATIDVPTLRAALDAGHAHAVVLGDRHSTTEVAPGVWYPGTPEVTHRRETDPGRVLVVDVDPDTGAVEAESVRVGRWAFLRVEERLDAEEDVARLAGRLAAVDDKARTGVWLTLSGTLTAAAHARLTEMLEANAPLFARLDHWERHTDLAVLPDNEDFADLGLSGFAQAALDDLVVQAKATDGGTAQDALALLYRFTRGNR